MKAFLKSADCYRRVKPMRSSYYYRVYRRIRYKLVIIRIQRDAGVSFSQHSELFGIIVTKRSQLHSRYSAAVYNGRMYTADIADAHDSNRNIIAVQFPDLLFVRLC